jgi:hypothetical protein
MDLVNPLTAGLDALYGLLIVHILPPSVYCMVMKPLKGTINLSSSPVLCSNWNLNPITTKGLKNVLTV